MWTSLEAIIQLPHQFLLCTDDCLLECAWKEEVSGVEAEVLKASCLEKTDEPAAGDGQGGTAQSYHKHSASVWGTTEPGLGALPPKQISILKKRLLCTNYRAIQLLVIVIHRIS